MEIADKQTQIQKAREVKAHLGVIRFNNAFTLKSTGEKCGQ